MSSTGDEIIEENTKVFIETFSNAEILQADLEILGVLLVSFMYYLMAGVVWTNLNADGLRLVWALVATGSDFYGFGESIKYYGGMSLTGLMLIFHIISMFGVLNEINMMLFDWVMGVAYPITLFTAALMYMFAENDVYVETGR